MRFADQRAKAESAILAGLPRDFKGDKERYAKKVVRYHNSYPQPETNEIIGKGASKRRLVYGSGKPRAERRKLGLVKPRKRIRGTLPPHPIAVINRAHQIQRNCDHRETYKEDSVIYCGNCHARV